MTRGLSCRNSLLVGVLAAASVSVMHAQVNIEALRSERAGSGLAATLGLNLLLRTGNVDLVELGIDGRIDYSTAKSLTFFLWNGDLGFISGNRFTNDGLVHLRHGWKLTRTVKTEAFGQLNYDKSRLLDFRSLLGGGLRIRILETGNVGLSLGIGYMYEHEVLDLSPDAEHPLNTNVHRASNYIVARITSDPRFALAATGYVQPQIDDPGDIRIVNNLGISVAVTKRIALRVKFNLRYDSRPPNGTAELDTELQNGLTIAF